MASQLTGAFMMDWVACFLLACLSHVWYAVQASALAEGTPVPHLVYMLLLAMIL